MNAEFKRLLKDQGLTMYGLCKRTKIPYTTINRLYNDKLDINNCNSSVVFAIARGLGVKMEQLLNDYDFLTGTGGNYHGIEYVWSKDDAGDQQLQITDDDESIVLWTVKSLTHPEYYQFYQMTAEMLIDYYLENKDPFKEYKGVLYA